MRGRSRRVSAGIFRNLPFCESETPPIIAPPQGFKSLRFSRDKIGPKQIQISQIGSSMSRPTAIGAEHRKDHGNIRLDRRDSLSR